MTCSMYVSLSPAIIVSLTFHYIYTLLTLSHFHNYISLITFTNNKKQKNYKFKHKFIQLIIIISYHIVSHRPVNMGRAPCCDKANVKKGPWSPEEDTKLKSYIEKNGTGGNWIALPQKIGLKRCGKSCRLRWLNYLRPDIRHGGFTEEEENIICNLYINIGSRWSIIAAQLPGRTDNDIKNYWNTRLKKKLMAKTRKEQAANRAVMLDQEIKRETTHNPDMFLLNQTLNQHQQLPYWPDPTQLSTPMGVHPNNLDDPLTRLLMKIGGQFYDDPQNMSNNYMDASQALWTGTEYEVNNNNNNNNVGMNVFQESSSVNFPLEVEAYFNNLMRFENGGDQSYSSVDHGNNSTTTTTTNSGGSGSWGDMKNSMVNTPVSEFDAYQNGVLKAM
ncbi:hypothetical protein RND81_13G186700 [Saponaria officinalis]|uniref:Uncharacterized protein n=1 Tax=Saponaria officinalis TaxID=3572 RepID=A0AAW1H232_SAPOF